MQRRDGRAHDEVRPISAFYGLMGNASSDILFCLGNTRILCAVSIQPGVPPFLRGSAQGWLTAEYALLPAATMQRVQRETSSVKRNGRSIEISRLIGRCLRVVTDLSSLGNRTIFIDCDVIEADGGTRTASITGAYIALARAERQWLTAGIIDKPLLKDSLLAISVGVMDGALVLDPDYDEDNHIDADFNFIMTGAGKLIEVQGGAEKEPIDWQQFDHMRGLVDKGMKSLAAFAEQQLTVTTHGLEVDNRELITKKKSKIIAGSLFSLKNRIHNEQQ